MTLVLEPKIKQANTVCQKEHPAKAVHLQIHQLHLVQAKELKEKVSGSQNLFNFITTIVRFFLITLFFLIDEKIPSLLKPCNLDLSDLNFF